MMLFIAIFFTIFWIAASVYLLFQLRCISYLRDVSFNDQNEKPRLAIIIAVRNEEADLEEALESLCRLHYRNYRLVVVNDRSTDRTEEILAKFEKAYSNLTVLHIKDLPQGWLGKNHALYKGYQSTKKNGCYLRMRISVICRIPLIRLFNIARIKGWTT
jgi:glycosyltransferase involved in cell wall biosynthesis